MTNIFIIYSFQGMSLYYRGGNSTATHYNEWTIYGHNIVLICPRYMILAAIVVKSEISRIDETFVQFLHPPIRFMNAAYIFLEVK